MFAVWAALKMAQGLNADWVLYISLLISGRPCFFVMLKSKSRVYKCWFLLFHSWVVSYVVLFGCDLCISCWPCLLMEIWALLPLKYKVLIPWGVIQNQSSMWVSIILTTYYLVVYCATQLQSEINQNCPLLYKYNTIFPQSLDTEPWLEALSGHI